MLAYYCFKNVTSSLWANVLSIYPMVKWVLIIWNITVGSNGFAIFFMRKYTLVETYFGAMTFYYLAMLVIDVVILCRFEEKTGESHLLQMEYETWKLDQNFLGKVRAEIAGIYEEKEDPRTEYVFYSEANILKVV